MLNKDIVDQCSMDDLLYSIRYKIDECICKTGNFENIAIVIGSSIMDKIIDNEINMTFCIATDSDNHTKESYLFGYQVMVDYQRPYQLEVAVAYSVELR